LNNYFDLLEDTLKDNEIFDDASCIFNCDETAAELAEDWFQGLSKG